MRYFLVVAYDGSKFYGFQRQNNIRSVQGDIEKELSTIFNCTILVKGAGRTDRGVHAKGQCLHFDSEKHVKPSFIRDILNKNLNDIYVKKCKIVSDDFHSRFSVKKKHYKYCITFNKSLYNSNYQLYVSNLDVHKMKEASKLFLGVHNFQNFVSGSRDNYECIIYRIKFSRRFNGLTIHFYGKSFYRYMVRNMVGALIDVGKCRATKDDISRLLNSDKTDKVLSTSTAKALTLVKIYY